MKTYISYLVIALLMTNALSGQVKIGDRPENLHNASVLELESTSRVLVITRVNDAQMSAINPLRGALVYNTDHDCLHYFNGTEWINICEALDNSFTVSTRADYLSQLFPSAKDSTVVITPTENPDGSLNYNFEVNVISRDNIGASAVTSSKIQNGSIENRHMAPKSISPLKFEDGNNAGDLLRWNGTIWELTNEADISISEADGDPTNEYNTGIALNGTSIEITDGGATLSQDLNGTFATDIELSDAITASDAVDLDKSETNELQDLNLAGNLLTLSNPATVGNQVNLAGYLDNTDEQNLGIGTGGIANESVEVTITDGTSATIDIRDADPDATNEIQNIEEVLTIGNDANGLVLTGLGVPTVASDAATKAYVDALDTDDADANPTNEIQNIEEVLTIGNDANGLVLTGLGVPTVASDAATKAYVDALDTDDADANPTNEIQNIEEVLTIGNDANGLVLTGLGVPTVASDAATKAYVDALDTDDADANPTNEIQNIEEVLTIGNDANGLVLTGLGVPTVASDAATKAYVDGITVSQGEGITVTNPPATQEFNVSVTNPVVAMGKINSDGTFDLGKIIGADINYDSLTPGTYNVTFNPARTIGDDNYVVQLTLLDAPNGATIKTINHTENGFTVEIHSAGSLTNASWYFTVTDF